MSNLILFTSGSTKEPKEVIHSWNDLNIFINNSIAESKLSALDIVLDVFPSNTIAHHVITAGPARAVGATLISLNFNPYEYIKTFNYYRPTYISLIPRHIEILSKTKEWVTLDMSCVRYMVTGSQVVSQDIIGMLLSKGVKIVANWYGMTEMPPPVFVGYNLESFNFYSSNYNVEFTIDGECIIDGFYTGDIFDIKSKKFIKRKINELNSCTWKTKS